MTRVNSELEGATPIRRRAFKVVLLVVAISIFAAASAVILLRPQQAGTSAAHADLLSDPVVANYRITHLPTGYAASRADSFTGSNGQTIYRRDLTSSNIKSETLGLLTISVSKPVAGGPAQSAAINHFTATQQSSVHGRAAYWYQLDGSNFVTWVEANGDRIQITSKAVSLNELQLTADGLVAQ